MNPLYFFLALAIVGAVDEDNAQFLKNGLPVWGTVIKKEVCYGRIMVGPASCAVLH
ncbi:MAG: hypothetical protein ACRYF0_15860 [Janthinobacterium lividum]